MEWRVSTDSNMFRDLPEARPRSSYSWLMPLVFFKRSYTSECWRIKKKWLGDCMMISPHVWIWVWINANRRDDLSFAFFDTVVNGAYSWIQTSVASLTLPTIHVIFLLWQGYTFFFHIVWRSAEAGWEDSSVLSIFSTNKCAQTLGESEWSLGYVGDDSVISVLLQHTEMKRELIQRIFPAFTSWTSFWWFLNQTQVCFRGVTMTEKLEKK